MSFILLTIEFKSAPPFFDRTILMNILLIFFRIVFILVALIFIAPVLAGDSVLEFRASDKLVSKISLAELKDKVKIHEINVFDSIAGKEKKYEAFAIQDLLNLVYHTQWTSEKYSDIAFIALDGYEALSKTATLNEEGGFLAFRDVDVNDGWELVGKQKVDPGPFFLMWTGKGQTSINAYPWPWQVIQINLLRFEDQYPSVFPTGAKLDSSAYRGFSTFRNRCIHCHSMGGMGGKIGPDLDAPQSIAAYRSEYMIKEMIKHSSKYRYSIMPDHDDLSDADLDDLYDYFQFQMNAKTTSN
jgi:mono/diheme cytochrome c family protein